MIKRLRLRFIRFATLAATAVLLVLGLILHLANYISVNNELNQMLDAICENQGRAPPAPPATVPAATGAGSLPPRPRIPPGILCCPIPRMGSWSGRSWEISPP